MPDETQQLIAGRYRLGRSLGSGGMGQVWAAEDAMLGRTVAVKVVDLRGRGDEDALRARVMREARAAARIDDPGSVRIFDVVDEGHAVYLVMELVEAPTLAEVVARTGPLDPHEAARLGLDVLGALAVAHRAGIVHRDVKPNNVMVLPDGRAKLADFGIASVKDDPAITSTGMVLGTPKYMSPEQARGEIAGAPADLWGLGALLYFAVEGEAPFDRGDTLPTLNAVLHDEPRPTQRAGGLAPVLRALLAKAPHDRPADDEARRLLEGVPAAETTMVLPPVTAPRPVAPPTATPTDRRWLAALAVVAVVALVAAVVLAATRDDDDPSAATTTTTAATSTTTSTTTTTTTTAPPPVVELVTYTSDEGWAIDHPSDWIPSPGPAGSVDFESPDGDYLRVDSVEKPGDDAVRAWEEQEARFRDEHPDYQRVRLEETDYRFTPAALWEYTYEGQHAANLGFVHEQRGYALNLVTAESRWAATQEQWQAFQDSFEPRAGDGDEGDDD